ncbi:hypothetical protein DY000_02010133 [Brassica cretica]|uniref:Protein kinase domain-containing protein n=1 Tax=Brassica cretica TaxID=69181 RepID=A0ABQ7BV15_BRACR|nr:hypothetical protein DY000_02010133 [Brassica cretica]
MRGFFFFFLFLTCLAFFLNPLHAGVPYNGSIARGFGGSQMNYINNKGIFLESINKDFGFGFITTPDDVTLFTLSIVHKSSSRLIWSANRASPVSNSDKLQFQDDGNVVLRREEQGGGGTDVWRLDNSGKNASRIELRDSGNLVVVSVIIVLVTIFIISVLIFVAFRILRRKKTVLDDDQDQEQSSDEDNFLDNLSGMPIRFTYKDLQSATNNFSVKLGQGGFGSVYEGSLPDGSRLAVKKLEGIGQGKKEFRAEVSIIGSIHHLHLVRLRGFCAEGAHRLLAYEFLAKGSLERWIFSRRDEDILLDWDTRFNIAVGTAKGLAYLHEDCDARIIHCDIKPENILLDDNFNAKVSDFGLAKLMTREQSHVFTTMRGTRGYLAPEWITNYAISEKSDVYSYGMVLLELIGGRKNYDPSESSEKCHFPSYAFKMMEEGKLLEIVDGKMKNFDVDDERVQRTMKTALWCIQEDMHLRPSMSKVVQMLEGVFPVVQPPSSSTLGSRLYSSFFKSISEEGGGTSSGPSDCNSENYISAVRLSGPR